MKFFEAVANVFRVPDLRRRVMFTLALLAVYRLGGHIPIPGIDTKRFEEFIQQNQGTLFGFFDLFSGGMFRRLTIFALLLWGAVHGIFGLSILSRGAAQSTLAFFALPSK